VAREEKGPSGRLGDGPGLGRADDRGPATRAPRPLHDTWIAACCTERGLPLLILNRRDFANFAEHDGLVLLDG
jgi:predicted nucleic acid-binding protein